MESPETLNSRATSWPRLPGAREKRPTRDVPGVPLQGGGCGSIPGLGSKTSHGLGNQACALPNPAQPKSKHGEQAAPSLRPVLGAVAIGTSAGTDQQENRHSA